MCSIVCFPGIVGRTEERKGLSLSSFTEKISMTRGGFFRPLETRLDSSRIPVLIKVTDSLRIKGYRSIHDLELTPCYFHGLEEPSLSPELTRHQISEPENSRTTRSVDPASSRSGWNADQRRASSNREKPHRVLPASPRRLVALFFVSAM